MFWKLCVVLLALCLLKILKGLFPKKKLVQMNGEKKRSIVKFTFLPISIPILDGLYTLYQIQKHGITVISDHINRLEDDKIYKVPFGPYPILMSRDAAVSRAILSSPNPGHLQRPSFLRDRIFNDIARDGLLTSPHDVWSRHRKILSRAFTFRCFSVYVGMINNHSKDLAKELAKLAFENGGQLSGTQVEHSLEQHTLKMTLELILGSEFSDSHEAIQFSKDFYECKQIKMQKFFSPTSYIPFASFWPSKTKAREEELVKRMNEFVKMVISYYKSNPDVGDNNGSVENLNRKCLIQELLSHNASTEEIHDEIGTFLVAGHETVNSTMNFLLHHFACNMEHQMRCRAEVDNHVEIHNDGLNLNGDDVCLDINALSNLDHLERFISESLRITPNAPFAVRELKAPLRIDEDCVVNKGKILAIPIIALHRNPKYYAEPERFDPDRFLPETVEKREAGSFIPFSGGFRNCIGRRMAMLELKAMSFWILRNFEICTTDELHGVKIFCEVTLKPERPFRTVLKLRKGQPLN